MSQKIEVKMSLLRKCKHSVRYDASDDASKKLMTSIYITNEVYEALSRPTKLMIVLQEG